MPQQLYLDLFINWHASLNSQWTSLYVAPTSTVVFFVFLFTTEKPYFSLIRASLFIWMTHRPIKAYPVKYPDPWCINLSTAIWKRFRLNNLLGL